VVTTHHALDRHGAVEVNPLLDDMGPDQTAAALLLLKGATWGLLYPLERRRPKLGRALKYAAGGLWLAVAAHNYAEVH
jgi:hypothetical protein